MTDSPSESDDADDADPIPDAAEPVPDESMVDAAEERPPGDADAADAAPLVESIPGGYQTVAGALGLAGAYYFLRSVRFGSYWRALALALVAVGAWSLRRRLRRVDGVGRAFSADRATATTLLCAALAGYGAAVEGVLLGVVAATVVLLASWATSPEGPVLGDAV